MGSAGAIQFSQELPGGGAVFAAVDRMGWEGMVSKQRSSVYRSGTTSAWLKMKCYATDEFEIIGIERERRKVPVALLNKGGKYAAAAIISLNRGLRERLWERVEAKKRPSPGGSLSSGRRRAWSSQAWSPWCASSRGGDTAPCGGAGLAGRILCQIRRLEGPGDVQGFGITTAGAIAD